MATWKTTVKPVATYDGQLFVDAEFAAWKWDAASEAWTEQEGSAAQKTRDAQAYCLSQPVGTPLSQMMPGQLQAEWDTLYSKSFVEISVEGVPTAYLSNLTFADVQAWLAANVPQNLGRFTQNARIQIYEVVLPQENQRIIGYNNLYSMARGGDAYNRRKGRQNHGLPWTFKIVPGFKAQPAGPWWTDGYTDPGQQFLQEFFGIAAAPSPDSDNIFWFPSKPGALYRQPRQGSLVYPGAYPRMVYDVGTSTYHAVTGGQVLQVGVPRFFGNYSGGTVRYLHDMGQLRGNQYFSQRRNGVLVYPLTYNDYRAFYLKPYGVDTLGIGFHIQNGWQVVAEYLYGTGVRDTSHRLVSTYGAWNDVVKLQRMSLNDLPIPALGNSKGIDDPYLPRCVQFYALHVPTGLRTPAFPRRLALSSRKCNLTMCFLPEIVG